MTSFNQMQHVDTQLHVIKTKIIDRLPKDLVIKIYKDYLEVEVYYMMYKNIIKSPISKTLDIKLLIPFLPSVFSKPNVCKYIREKCNAFNSSFTDHKINNNKQFNLMLKGQSFAATILCTLYIFYI